LPEKIYNKLQAIVYFFAGTVIIKYLTVFLTNKINISLIYSTTSAGNLANTRLNR